MFPPCWVVIVLGPVKIAVYYAEASTLIIASRQSSLKRRKLHALGIEDIFQQPSLPLIPVTLRRANLHCTIEELNRCQTFTEAISDANLEIVKGAPVSEGPNFKMM